MSSGAGTGVRAHLVDADIAEESTHVGANEAFHPPPAAPCARSRPLGGCSTTKSWFTGVALLGPSGRPRLVLVRRRAVRVRVGGPQLSLSVGGCVPRCSVRGRERVPRLIFLLRVILGRDVAGLHVLLDLRQGLELGVLEDDPTPGPACAGCGCSTPVISSSSARSRAATPSSALRHLLQPLAAARVLPGGAVPASRAALDITFVALRTTPHPPPPPPVSSCSGAARGLLLLPRRGGRAYPGPARTEPWGTSSYGLRSGPVPRQVAAAPRAFSTSRSRVASRALPAAFPRTAAKGCPSRNSSAPRVAVFSGARAAIFLGLRSQRRGHTKAFLGARWSDPRAVPARLRARRCQLGLRRARVAIVASLAARGPRSVRTTSPGRALARRAGRGGLHGGAGGGWAAETAARASAGLIPEPERASPRGDA